MIDSSSSHLASGRTTIPLSLAIPLFLLLIGIFIAVLFPWDSLAHRVTYELARASGGQITIAEIGPAFTARGMVLRARDVRIAHPAFDRVSVSELEIAPRFSTSWFSGAPALRVWAESELGLVDGVVVLGGDSAFVGNVSKVKLERLPLRLESSGVALSGELDAEADVKLDPTGVLRGRVDFTSSDLVVRSDQLPIALAFSRAEGVIEILEDGATRIDSVVLEGEAVEGDISGEIGLVHHSTSPPIDISAQLRILDPLLRQLAPSAGFSLSPDGETSVRVRGTLDQPELESLPPGNRE